MKNDFIFNLIKVFPSDTQWARKFKKVQAEKTREINFTNIFFDQIPFFAISKMTKNQFLNWEKVQNYHGKNFFDLFDFMSFFAWTF